MDRTRLQLLSLSLLTLLLVSSTSSACIGLVAGKIHFNVTAGTNETLQMQIFNACQNQSVYYQTEARFSPVANQITPNVVISPVNGTIPPAGQLFLNITVYMPYNAIPGTVWHGGAVAGEAPNASSHGATITTGVIKQISATAIAAPVNYALYAAIGIVVVIGAAGGAAYYLKFAKKGARSAKKATARAKPLIKLPKKEKKMTYAEFKAMEAKRRGARRRPAARKTKRRTARRSPSRRRRR